jgi:hypothetical protein
VEREILKEHLPLERAPPQIEIVERPEGIGVRIDRSETVYSWKFPGTMFVDGKRVKIESGMPLFALLDRIENATRAPQSRLEPRSPFWLEMANPASARAAMDKVCVPSKWEYYTKFWWRSPDALMDSAFGYLNHFIGAAIGLDLFRSGMSMLANCEKQAKVLRDITRWHRIAMKELTCTEESDQSIEFWTSEKDEDGKHKVVKFNLDFIMLMAQEDAPDDYLKNLRKKKEEEEAKKQLADAKDGKKLRAKAAAKKKKQDDGSDDDGEEGSDDLGKKYYLFDTEKLHEVRVLEEVNGEYSCTPSKPGDPDFAKLRDDVEKYRQVFYYMGNHAACEGMLRQKVRYPRPPAYLDEKPIEVPTASPSAKSPPPKKSSKHRANDEETEPNKHGNSAR